MSTGGRTPWSARVLDPCSLASATRPSRRRLPRLLAPHPGLRVTTLTTWAGPTSSHATTHRTQREHGEHPGERPGAHPGDQHAAPGPAGATSRSTDRCPTDPAAAGATAGTP